MIPRYTLPEMEKIWNEENAFKIWLRVEIAACEAWQKLGLITEDEICKIKQAKFNMELYEQNFNATRHDVVSFVKSVTASLGDEGKWIHYGLTSNDVKDTALSIQLVESCQVLLDALTQLQKALISRARQFKDLVCAGRSHGMHAEPMSFGAKFALWSDDAARNIKRLRQVAKHAAICKMSGPVGSYATIPPEIEELTAQNLNLKPAKIANQIIQRDIHAEYVTVLAITAACIEKIATEFRHLQRTEVAEVSEPFNRAGYVSKGSSSMPHKRNPELSERICGLARIIRGNAVVAIENVALWHERDISHSSAERIILPDSSKALHYMLDLMVGIVKNMQVNETRIKDNLEISDGIMFAPRIMLELVAAGMSRTEAYDMVQDCSAEALNTGNNFRSIVTKNKVIGKLLTRAKIEQIFDYRWYVRYIDKQLEQIDSNHNG